MNRKSKIIVSVVGITIVLLALLGITYAYYLTRIEGNTNTNSISVSTADLKLKYDDGNGNIVENDIMPGKVITKDFSVTNDGQSKVDGYLVVLENVHNTLTRKSDLVYTLDCKLSDETSCGTVIETIYPTNTLSIIYTNDIDIGVTHNYTLTITYKNLEDTDQSEDMGKMFDGRINIMDANTNPYKTGVSSVDDKSLTYNIINNAMSGENGTKYSSNPLTEPIKEVSASNERILSVIQDNLGTSYYFRGKVNNNYVLFNDMCFRIVRIEGDGSVKLIFAGDGFDETKSCNNVTENSGVLDIPAKLFGYKNIDIDEYDYFRAADYANYEGGLNDALESWYNSKFTSQELNDLVKVDKWCLGDKIDNYEVTTSVFSDYINFESGTRIYGELEPNLMCENEDYVESKYGAITVDEAALAGVIYNPTYIRDPINNTNYLYDEAQTEMYWTLSYAFRWPESDAVFTIRAGYTGGDFVVYGNSVRPVITLKSGVEITSGVGTQISPYIIKISN